MRRVLALVAVLAVAPASAGWEFVEPVAAVAAPEGIFPHLEAAGRASLAVAGDGAVALTWEDNRSGKPQAYVAFTAARGFSDPIRISTGAEAYEPAVAPVGAGRFVFAWEQDGAVWMRLGTPERLGAAVRVAAAGRQPTLAGSARGAVYAAWVARDGRFGRVAVARLAFETGEPSAEWVVPADPDPVQGDQLYPALAVAGGAITVGFEDRRHGHTRLYTVRGEGRHLAPVAQLNETGSGNAPYGRGSGVTRLAIDAGGGLTAAAWMDKRHFRGGYDVYAAVAPTGRPFGANELVQDLFGENQPQWHPDAAVSPDGKRVVAAWDDPRDGSPDVWLSWRDANGVWSDDTTLPGGSGPGAQTHPVVGFDPGGRLHAAWIDRSPGGVLRILYTTGEWRGD